MGKEKKTLTVVPTGVQSSIKDKIIAASLKKPVKSAADEMIPQYQAQPQVRKDYKPTDNMEKMFEQVEHSDADDEDGNSEVFNQSVDQNGNVKNLIADDEEPIKLDLSIYNAPSRKDKEKKIKKVIKKKRVATPPPSEDEEEEEEEVELFHTPAPACKDCVKLWTQKPIDGATIGKKGYLVVDTVYNKDQPGTGGKIWGSTPCQPCREKTVGILQAFVKETMIAIAKKEQTTSLLGYLPTWLAVKGIDIGQITQGKFEMFTFLQKYKKVYLRLTFGDHPDPARWNSASSHTQHFSYDAKSKGWIPVRGNKYLKNCFQALLGKLQSLRLAQDRDRAEKFLEDLSIVLSENLGPGMERRLPQKTHINEFAFDLEL